MANPASTKKQIAESIKQANSILVTVSRNPSVDELSAALGLTIFLNKLEKHATAVFSGKVPMAISFLEPDKTFESTADSLRDFIIALDKEKADHLRYKVVDDSVKIFITPYRTTITENDLEFSQGDYNVELVIALNVEKHSHLDLALTAHGKILHDADIMTVTAGEIKSTLGSTDWHDDEASGVSEMLVGLLNDLKSQKAPIDKQIATALLTGIVSATDRFANEATSSRAMTAAATLMAAGANQQLIATKLEAAERGVDNSDEAGPNATQGVDGSTFLKEGASTKLVSQKRPNEPSAEPPAKGDDGSITITHSSRNDLDEVARQVAEQGQRKAAKAAKAELDKLTSAGKDRQNSGRYGVDGSDEDDKEPVDIFASVDNKDSDVEQFAPSPPDIAEDLRRTTEQMIAENQTQDVPTISPSIISPNLASSTPSVGGTLNATTAQAAEDKRRAIEQDQNRTILKHGKPIGSRVPSLSGGSFNASMAPPDTPPSVDVFSAPAPSFNDSYNAESISSQSIAQVTPANSEPQQYIEQLPPQYQQQETQPNFAPGYPPTIAEIEAQRSAQLAAQAAPQPPLPPMPDFNNLPPLPSMPVGVDPSNFPSLPHVPSNQPAPPQQDFKPSQFQIPTQQ